MYKGEFDKGNFVENGKIIKLNGKYYIGQFKGIKIEGKGILFNKDNTICYEGEFLNNKMHGFGNYMPRADIIMKVNSKRIQRMEKAKFLIKTGK